MSWFLRLLILVALAALGACQPVDHVPRTEVMVRIDSEPLVLAQMSYLWISISSQEGRSWIPRREFTLKKQELEWPIEFGVIPIDDDPERVFEVVVRALDRATLDGAKILGEQRAVIGFRRGETRLVRLTFYDDCLTLFERKGLCEEELDCHGPECRVCIEGSCEQVGMTKTEPWTGPADQSVSELDAGTGSQDPEDAGEAGAPATMGDDGGTDGGETVAGTKALALDAPDVVAAPGCVRVRVTREVNGQVIGEQPFTFDTAGRGDVFADADCTMPLTAPLFAANALTSDLYVAPSLAAGSYVATATMSASIGDVSAVHDVEIRMRARKILRGEDTLCSVVDDGSVFCNGWTSLGRLGRPIPEPTTTQYVPTQAFGGSKLGATSRFVSRDWFSCYIRLTSQGDTEGPLFCWGGGEYGQLGNGLQSNSSSPVHVSALGSSVRHVAVGIRHVCAVTSADELYCWGNNTERGIQDDAQVDYPTPSLVTRLAEAGASGTVAELTLAWGATCARMTSGEVWCWGGVDSYLPFGAAPKKITGLPGTVERMSANNYDVCAIVEVSAPTPHDEVACFDASGGVTSIAGFPAGAVIDDIAGSFHATCASADGALYCWGKNPKGWLGTGSKALELTTAKKVQLPAGRLEGFALAGAYQTNLSAIVDGIVYSWGCALGDGGPGSLGLDLDLESQPSPIRNANLDGAEEVFPGIYGGCALRASDLGAPADLGLACWGSGLLLGNDGGNDLPSGNFTGIPAVVPTLSSGVTRFESASEWSIAIQDGTAKAWGQNAHGSLGTGTSSYGAASTPVDVLLPGTVLDVGASVVRGCALVEDPDTKARAVYCWGDWDADEQTSLPEATPAKVLDGDATLTDVDVSLERGCALLGGQVQCWAFDSFVGGNGFAVSVEAALASSVVTAIDMGPYSLCAHLSNGSVKCEFQYSPMATRFTNVQEVRAGARHACAVKTNGTVQCVGTDNARGQLGSADPNATSVTVSLVAPVTALGVGDDGSCARDAEGWKCWGDNLHNGLGLVSDLVVSTPTRILPWVVAD